MRIAMVTLLSTLVLIGSGGPGVRAGDMAEVEKELKKFQGAWTFESVEAAGKKLPADQFKGMTVVFEGSKYSVKMDDVVVEAATLKLDLSRSPKTLDAQVIDGPNKGKVYLCIYEIDGDTLKVCFDEEGKKRPTEFNGEGGANTLVVHKRVKK
jgi:uncharacterized protein (TIGR03067 family)